MTLTLPQPPQLADKTLERHLFRVQQLLEQADRTNLKADDIAARTSKTFRSMSATGSVGQGDDVILVDASSGAVTVTLPPAADRFKELNIKKIDSSSNAVTIDGNGSEEIDGSTTLVMATQNDAVRISSDGSAWWVL